MGVFRMACFLRYCVFGLLSLSALTAEAARQKPVVRPASAQDVFVKGGTTLDIDRHWGEILDVPGGRTTLPVTHKSGYSFARVGGMIKTAINSNPAKYAATAAVTYLITQLPGASFDPQTGQLLMTPSGLVPVNATNSPWGAFYNGQKPGSFGSPSSACQSLTSYVSSYLSAQTGERAVFSSTVRLNDFNFDCKFQKQYKNAEGGWVNSGVPVAIIGWGISTSRSSSVICPSGATYNNLLGTCNAPAASVPMTPADIEQLVSNTPGITQPQWQQLGPELLADIPATFDGPDSTAFDGPSSVTGTPTITTTLDQVSGTSTVVESIPVHNFDFSTNPLSITTTTTTVNNTYQNGTLVSTTTQTQGQPSTEVSEVPAQLEIPTDCDFMPTVCSFIDWVKTPFNEEEPDLSELISDEDFEKEINFSSNATCPGPSMISTSHGDFEFSWEPGCQWAAMIKPLIIIAALVAAIFINLGTSRGPE